MQKATTEVASAIPKFQNCNMLSLARKVSTCCKVPSTAYIETAAFLIYIKYLVLCKSYFYLGFNQLPAIYQQIQERIKRATLVNRKICVASFYPAMLSASNGCYSQQIIEKDQLNRFWFVLTLKYNVNNDSCFYETPSDIRHSLMLRKLAQKFCSLFLKPRPPESSLELIEKHSHPWIPKLLVAMQIYIVTPILREPSVVCINGGTGPKTSK